MDPSDEKYQEELDDMVNALINKTADNLVFSRFGLKMASAKKEVNTIDSQRTLDSQEMGQISLIKSHGISKRKQSDTSFVFFSPQSKKRCGKSSNWSSGRQLKKADVCLKKARFK